MKYSSALKFNAVAEWWDDYIAYDNLKKVIYQLERKQHNSESLTPYRDIEANEETALMSSLGVDGQEQPAYRATPTDAIFVPLLNKELKKIVLFFEQQEKELARDIAELGEDVELQERLGLAGAERYMDFPEGNLEDDDDESISQSPVARYRKKVPTHTQTLSPILGGSSNDRRPSFSSEEEVDPRVGSLPSPRTRSPSATFGRFASKFTHLGSSWNPETAESAPGGLSGGNVWTSKADYAYDTRMLYKRKITNLWVLVSSLKSYIEVNSSGFRKIMKKYDKVTDSELKDYYMATRVSVARPFSPATKALLSSYSARLLALYTKCVTYGDSNMAKDQLQVHQREHIAWERDTVWRQMIASERRGDEDGLPKSLVVVSHEDSDAEHDPDTKTRRKTVKTAIIDWETGVGRFRVTQRKMWLLAAIVILIILLNVEILEVEEANRCFAILVFCTILWATEAIPLFVTSMSVPLLLVLLKVIREEDKDERKKGPAMPRKDATKYVFSIMFSPTIMLLIGGFTISSALSKTNIDRILITRVLSVAGTKPRNVLLAFMGVSCFASMWISNVAAPTLCFTLIKPILRTLPPKASFGPCLILAIALAANIGGQSSPISSPQNLIALGEMNPKISWPAWFAVALPVSGVSILLIWVLLLWAYQPSRHPGSGGPLEIKAIRPTRETFTLKQYWVAAVTLVTIGLWCVETAMEEYVGDMGVIAILPIVAFFATGVLKKDDFEQFMWTIVFLAMGGIALGKGVMSSGLLDILGDLIKDLVQGYSLYSVVLILSPIVLVISTFISHTIASVLLVPIAREIGDHLPGKPHNLLIFITALICSAGMGMPVSGFPNQTAATQEDALGEFYLSNVDFLKNGVPASIIATAVVATVGFVIMKMISI